MVTLVVGTSVNKAFGHRFDLATLNRRRTSEVILPADAAHGRLIRITRLSVRGSIEKGTALENQFDAAIARSTNCEMPVTEPSDA